MRNMDTESENGRATPKNLPLGDTLIPSGASPTKKGEPAIGVSAPFDPTLKAEMSPDPAFPAYTDLPLGVTAIEMPKKLPDPPVANGEPGTGVKAPVVVLIEKPLTLSLPVLAT